MKWVQVGGGGYASHRYEISAGVMGCHRVYHLWFWAQDKLPIMVFRSYRPEECMRVAEIHQAMNGEA